MSKTPATAWENVGKWYHKNVGQQGHFYHQTVVLPKLLTLLQLNESSKVLDLACGQGVLARHLPAGVSYIGIDAAPQLIKQAQKLKQHSNQKFLIGDVTQSLPIKDTDFTHATIVLALQNISQPERALKNAAQHLVDNGTVAIVLNHPCFRIPRQSSWGTDEAQKIQYRRLNRYLSPLKIPIQAHPGADPNQVTWSFHKPLSSYVKMMTAAGLVVTGMEEWISEKQSQGPAATMENRSRQEFPLFLTLLAKKISFDSKT
jgi:ubiquinone/menaquinone biosynthesis C-methylase UbiE